MRSLGLFALNVCATLVIVFMFVNDRSNAGNCPSSSVASASCIGDSNGDGNVNVADAVHTLHYLFNGGPPPAANAFSYLTQEQVDLLSEILPHMSVEQLPDGVGGTNKTIRFTGVNVQIVNGLGATNGNPANRAALPGQTYVNGLGNLIVGYDEVSGAPIVSPEHTGSHNIVSGTFNSYTGFGGLVVGSENTIAEAMSTVVGGSRNTASGRWSSVSGGWHNQATDTYASVLGGRNNTASANWSTVSGGGGNVASGAQSSVSGGLNRNAADQYDWAAGALWQDQ